MDSLVISMVSAATALVASIVGPVVTLAVARRQFNANVLSANRQRWMESLRDLVSELISQVVAVMVVKKRRNDSWNEDPGTAAEDPELLRRIERMVLIHWKIRLLLNPAKPPHEQLSRELEAILERLKEREVSQQDTRMSVERITRLAQTILLGEWDRVKKGV